MSTTPNSAKRGRSPGNSPKSGATAMIDGMSLQNMLTTLLGEEEAERHVGLGRADAIEQQRQPSPSENVEDLSGLAAGYGFGGDSSASAGTSSSDDSDVTDDDEATQQQQQQGDEGGVENPPSDNTNPTNEDGGEGMSSEARAALSLFKPSKHNTTGAHGGIPIPLTTAIVEAIITSRLPLSFVLRYADAGLDLSTGTAHGCRAILEVIEGCIARRRYFDATRLELFVVVMGIQTITDAVADGAEGNLVSDSNTDSASSTTSSSSFKLFSTNGTTATAAALPLPTLTRLMASRRNRKFLPFIASFWSPFMLSVIGAGATRFRNVLDVEVCLEACDSLPMCGLATTTTNNATATAEGVLQSRAPSAAALPAVLLSLGVATAPSAPLVVRFLSMGYALNTLYEEVLEAFGRAPPCFSPSAASATVSAAASYSASSSSLLAHSLRESAALHVCGLMTHNGMYVNVAKAVKLLGRLVSRSQRLHTAVEGQLLAPLRRRLLASPPSAQSSSLNSASAAMSGLLGGGDSSFSSTSIAAVAAAVKYPTHEADVLSLINKHRDYFVVVNNSQSPPPVGQSSSPPSSSSALIVGPSHLSDPSFIATCPLAASWATLKRLKEGGEALQRFLKPMAGVISETMARQQQKEKDARRGTENNGGDDDDDDGDAADDHQLPLPLIDVHPQFSPKSVTGRVFTSTMNPNIQTIRASSIVITSGCAEGDALVDALLLSEASPPGVAAEGDANTEGTNGVKRGGRRIEGTSRRGGRSGGAHRKPLAVNLRSFFVAPPGTTMVSFDYNQIELRVLAHLSKDKNLLAAFGVYGDSSGGGDQPQQDAQPSVAAPPTSSDVLRYVAHLMFGTPSLEAVTTAQRAQAKAVVYGILYGMGDRALQQRLNELLSQTGAGGAAATTGSAEKKEGSAAAQKSAVQSPPPPPPPPPPPLSASELRRLFNKTFPQATDYIQQVGSDALLTRQAGTFGGKYRQLAAPAAADVFSPTSSAAATAGSAAARTSGGILDATQYAARNQAVSMRIQGSAADILKSAMGELINGWSPCGDDTDASSLLPQKEDAEQQQHCFALLLSLHDELIFVLPTASGKVGGSSKNYSPQQQQLEATVAFIAGVMEAQSRRFGMCVPLKVNVKRGKNFGELQ